jgi:hypothetical protein
VLNLNFCLILGEHGHDPPHLHFITLNIYIYICTWLELRSLHSSRCLGWTGVEKGMEVLGLAASQVIYAVPVCCSTF